LMATAAARVRLPLLVLALLELRAFWLALLVWPASWAPPGVEMDVVVIVRVEAAVRFTVGAVTAALPPSVALVLESLTVPASVAPAVPVTEPSAGVVTLMMSVALNVALVPAVMAALPPTVMSGPLVKPDGTTTGTPTLATVTFTMAASLDELLLPEPGCDL